MMAAWQTEVGAFQQPRISGPVPANERAERGVGIRRRGRRKRCERKKRGLRTSEVEDSTSFFGIDGDFELDLRSGGEKISSGRDETRRTGG